MSAEAFARQMPAVVTLDYVAAMNAAHPNGRRFELSPDRTLWVMPPPDPEHALIADRLMSWLSSAGWPADQLRADAGIRIPGPDGDGGRVPDLTLWTQPRPSEVWSTLTGLLLVVEVVSVGSAVMDGNVKRREYATARIPHYWVVDRDTARTVTLYALGDRHTYLLAARMPLALLLQTSPESYGVTD